MRLTTQEELPDIHLSERNHDWSDWGSHEA